MSRLGDTFRRLLGCETSRDAVTVQRVYRQAKVIVGCEARGCAGYPEHHAVIQAAHSDAATKYRTKDGRTVQPADMVKSDGKGRTRYSVATIAVELDKCRALCSNCHALETHGPRPSTLCSVCGEEGRIVALMCDACAKED